MINITLDQFKKLFPNCSNSAELVPLLNEELKKFNINTKQRVAMFLAQCAHESNNFSVVKENLNYSADRLLAVFPKYFKSKTEALAYGRNPKKIANRVYANRMGNGAEASNDGFNYCGRGFIQLTGRNNYTAFQSDLKYKTILTNPSQIERSLKLCLETALWYWNKNNLNVYADKNDIKGCTRAINGGYIGLEERTKKYVEVLSVLK